MPARRIPRGGAERSLKTEQRAIRGFVPRLVTTSDPRRGSAVRDGSNPSCLLSELCTAAASQAWQLSETEEPAFLDRNVGLKPSSHFSRRV